MRKMHRLAVVVAVAASLVAGSTGCKPDCQNSVQSNGPNNINTHCDK